MLKIKVKTVALWAVLSCFILEVSSESCSDPEWNEDHDEIEEINYQGSAYQCDILIIEDRLEVDEGDDVSIGCDTRIDSGMNSVLSECRWYSPDGAECVWNTEEDFSNQNGQYCGSDSSVQFRGSFRQSRCDITIREVEEKHSGLWKCVAGSGAAEYVDNIDVVMDGGLSTQAIVGITVPIALIVLILLFLLLICLCCPAWLDRCRSKKDKDNLNGGQDMTQQSRAQPIYRPPSQGTSIPPPPLPLRPQVEDSVYEVTSQESSADMTARPLRNQSSSEMYDQVSYMHPTVNNQQNYGPTKTAKKISNISFFSRGSGHHNNRGGGSYA